MASRLRSRSSRLASSAARPWAAIPFISLRTPPGHGWAAENLLTVVTHELGHSLGLGDLNPSQVANDLMTETLAPGVGRLPSALDVAAINAVHAAALGATPTSAAPPALDFAPVAAAIYAAPLPAPTAVAALDEAFATTDWMAPLTTLPTDAPVSDATVNLFAQESSVEGGQDGSGDAKAEVICDSLGQSEA